MASGDNLSAIDRLRLAEMIALHEGWARWQNARAEVLIRALCAVQTRLLKVDDVCKALGISRDTYYRHVHPLRATRAVPGSDLEAEIAAEVHRTLLAAGMNDTSITRDEVKNNPDLELALAGIGVHHVQPKEQ